MTLRLTRRRDPRTFWLLTSPTLVILLVVGVYPLVASLWMALNRSQVTGPSRFVGFDNFARLAADPRFWNAIINSLAFATLALSLELVFGLAVALALRRSGRETWLVPVFMLPMLISPVVAAVTWLMLYHPTIGLINYVLRPLIGTPAWLANSSLALPSLVVVDIWEWTPFVFLLLRAAYLGASVEIEEAARVDGAGRIALFRHILLPQLAPAIGAVLLIRGIDVLKVFDTIYVMTGGGPGLSTETLGIYIYRAAFEDFNVGYAAALSYVQFALVIVLGLLFIRRVGRTQQ